MLDEANANEEPKKNGVRNYTDAEIKYGWFKIRPGFMQLMLKPFICLLTLVGCSSTQSEYRWEGEMGGGDGRGKWEGVAKILSMEGVPPA